MFCVSVCVCVCVSGALCYRSSEHVDMPCVKVSAISVCVCAFVSLCACARESVCLSVYVSGMVLCPSLGAIRRLNIGPNGFCVCVSVCLLCVCVCVCVCVEF